MLLYPTFGSNHRPRHHLCAHHEGARVSLSAVEHPRPLEPDVGVVHAQLLPRVLAGSDRSGELVYLGQRVSSVWMMVRCREVMNSRVALCVLSRHLIRWAPELPYLKNLFGERLHVAR